MGSNITLSSGIRSNLLNLQGTADLLATTQKRLSTGKKVNSALDNPNSFFTASALSNRANDLSSILDGVSNSVKTLEAADQGVKTLTTLVNTAKSIANQALQAGTNANGSLASTANNITRASTVTTGGKISLNNAGGPTVDFTVANGATIGSVIDQVNNAGLGFKAEIVTVGTNNNLKISSTAGKDITIAYSGASNSLATDTGIAAGSSSNASSAASAQRADLAKQFDDVRTQINQLVKDTGFNGKNLLNGDSLDVVFNEKTGSDKSSLSIQGVTFDATGLGISAASNSFAAESDITSAVASVDNALSTIRTQSSKFGSNLGVVQARQDFTKNLINTLQSGADNLTLADQNEEAANLLALQTRQQLSQTTLSLASQSDQAVLRLFG